MGRCLELQRHQPAGVSLLLGSVSHEGIAQLFLPSESELSIFTRFARWEKVSLVPKDYEYLPDLKRFI